MQRLRALTLVALLLAAGACTDDGGEAPDDDAVTTTTDPGDTVLTAGGALPELTPIRVARLGDRPAFVDGDGREVLLRGANFNALGDYHQADPAFAPTRPPTDADWDGMAAAGFGVVRLIVSWSALEPVRGQIDTAYVERIRQAIDAAAARRIYTVVDMHQDAWGKFIATPPGTVCPEGTEPAIGWDGAPQWATLTDGAETCRPLGYREGSAAVRAAFTAFYENRDGIRDAFAATWHRLVAALGDTPAIAGYDLLNEPNLVLEATASEQRYTELLRSTLAEVRAGEAEAGVAPRVVFVEPIVLYPLPGSLPTHPLAMDDQLAFAPHNYAEVIGPKILTVEQTFEVAVATATERDWPLWIGEHGVFAVDDATRDVNRRFAAAQDAALAGGAQWQWRQWCGDPHAIGVPGRAVTEVQVQLNDVTCPADASTGPNDELMRVAGRAYPRAAPGRLTDLDSDPDARTVSITGVIDDDLASGGDLVVWIPGEERPEIEGQGLGEPVLSQVPGGWYVTVEVVDSPYELDAR
ncbi:MAG TPA: cellulase family glycosylhydrolase [Iamia sp.]